MAHSPGRSSELARSRHLGGLPDVTLLRGAGLAGDSRIRTHRREGTDSRDSERTGTIVECSARRDSGTAESVRESSAETGACPVRRMVAISEDDHQLSCGRRGEASAAPARDPICAAFPLPLDLDVAAANENASSASLAQDIRDQVANAHARADGGRITRHTIQRLSSAFLPVVENIRIVLLLQSLEPPDGALAGMLARTR